MKIVTIIPAYNEEKTIESVVKGALVYGDVVVVDDGSTDDTATLARGAGAIVLNHHKNMGKGAAIKTGAKFVIDKGYDVIVFMDGDGQHNPEDIGTLAMGVNGAQIVIGSRFNGDIDTMPIHRRFSNRLTTWILRYITGYHITDSQSGFRAINANYAPLLVGVSANDYIYESEVLIVAAEHGLIIDEVPVNCHYGHEKSYIRAGDVLRYIIFILKLLIHKMTSHLEVLK